MMYQTTATWPNAERPARLRRREISGAERPSGGGLRPIRRACAGRSLAAGVAGGSDLGRPDFPKHNLNL